MPQLNAAQSKTNSTGMKSPKKDVCIRIVRLLSFKSNSVTPGGRNFNFYCYWQRHVVFTMIAFPWLLMLDWAMWLGLANEPQTKVTCTIYELQHKVSAPPSSSLFPAQQASKSRFPDGVTPCRSTLPDPHPILCKEKEIFREFSQGHLGINKLSSHSPVLPD